MSDVVVEEPRRLHPISPVFALVANARQMVIPLLAAFAAGEWWFVAPIVVITIGRMLNWIRFTYQVDGDVIRVHEGLLVRKQRTIALDRVQQIDVVRKLRHRLFGVVGFHVDTASGARGAELELEVIALTEAERLRALLSRFAPGAAVDAEAAAEDAPHEDDAESAVVSLSNVQLALAGMTGAQTLVILSLVYSVQEVLEFVDVDRVRRLIPDGAQSEPAAIVGAVLSLGVLWLALAAAALVLTHYRYTLTITGDQLRVTRGLLDRREVGALLGRVQAVRVEQTFIRRMLGFAALRVQTAAVPGQSVTRIVVPYVAAGDIERIARAVMPAMPPWPPLTQPPPAAFTLALGRRVAPTVVVATVTSWLFWPWGGLALFAIPLSVLAAWLHWTALGYAWSDGVLWARHGGLFRETVIVPAAKAQSLRLTSSWPQRRSGLATLRIDVAGRGSTPRVSDAPVAELEPMVDAMPDVAALDERETRIPMRAG